MRSRHRWPVVAALTRFWADDKGLSVFSVLLLLVAFVLPVVPAAGRRRPFGEVVFALLLVSGVLALGQRKLTRLVLMPVALITLAVDIARWVLPVGEPWIRATSLLSLLLFLAVVLGQTLRKGPITPHRIQGGVAAYLLLGVIWADAYALVELLRPGAFSGPLSPGDGASALFYFSFTTLTTVGYGDIVPVHPAARSLANLEAVTGPLYLAILIARLVSLAPAPGREPGPDA